MPFVEYVHTYIFRKSYLFLQKQNFEIPPFREFHPHSSKFNVCRQAYYTAPSFTGMHSRVLVIFDFDETISSAVTMRQILSMLPEYRRPPIYDFAKYGWLDYANNTLKAVHSMGYSPQILSKFLCAIPPMPGMVKFIQYLWWSKKPKYDLIIISDCYRYFIVNWLQQYKLLNCFTGIYCNPSKLTDCGELVVSAYHCANCQYSPPNLCKRQVMSEFILMQRYFHINYDRLIFVGNGSDDFCPALNMCPWDLICARRDDMLADRLAHNRKKLNIKTEIFLWVNGYDLMAKLQRRKC